MKENTVLKVDEKGRITLPLKLRKEFSIEPGDIFFIKPDEIGIRLAKAENPFDTLVEYAHHERNAGKSCELRAFAKENDISIDQ